jgi:hypothetical protein
LFIPAALIFACICANSAFFIATSRCGPTGNVDAFSNKTLACANNCSLVDKEDCNVLIWDFLSAIED